MYSTLLARAYKTALSPLPSAEKKRHSILVAEDDDEMRKLLMYALRADGYKVTDCHNGWEVLVKLEPFIVRERPMDFDLIISDIRMPGITGLEILEDVQIHKEFPPTILITAFGDDETHAQAKRFGAAAIFDKPFDIDNLLTKVRELLSFE